MALFGQSANDCIDVQVHEQMVPLGGILTRKSTQATLTNATDALTSALQATVTSADTMLNVLATALLSNYTDQLSTLQLGRCAS